MVAGGGRGALVTQSSGVRAEAWVWLGGGTPRWIYNAEYRPPLTPQEKRAAASSTRSQMVAEAIAVGGQRAADFHAGMVDGVHDLELVEPIKQLKRDGRLREALDLCYRAIEGAEGDSKGREPAPWCTEQAAIIHRKLGEKDKEIAALRRWLDRTPPERRPGGRIAERLAKLHG